MTKEEIKDIIGWDIVNWSRTLDYWEKQIQEQQKNNRCLELGGRLGGLSLWLAMKGNQVICSDLESPEKEATAIHQKYECNSLITYQSIDATNIPYENHFDIVCFKSILGGISRNNHNELKKKTINEVYKALKKDGILLFAENLESSSLHSIFRKHFVKWGSEWNYLKIDEIDDIFESYKKVKYTTVGFWGAFGRKEWQRNLFGRIDKVFEKMVFKRMRYIIIGTAQK
ncbi:methyltransferase domain-containing protein [candidate division KSB1 bacterium]